MEFGSQQICAYGWESTYGSPALPAYILGIVTSGAISEQSDVACLASPETDELTALRYGKTAVTLSLSVIPYSYTALADLLTAQAGGYGVPKSITLYAGVNTYGIYLKRLVGAVLESADIIANPDEPLRMECQFKAKYLDLTAPITIELPPARIFGFESLAVYDSGYSTMYPVPGVKGVQINVANDVQTIYTADSTNLLPRTFAYPLVTKHNYEALFSSWTRLYHPVQAGLAPNPPVRNFRLNLYDVCTKSLDVAIYLNQCLVLETVEQLSPIQPVVYNYQLKAKTITIVD